MSDKQKYKKVHLRGKKESMEQRERNSDAINFS